MGSDECIKVVVRCRPFNKRELEAKEAKTVNVDPKNGLVQIFNATNRQDETKSFRFDSVFDESSTQIEVFSNVAQPIVDAVLDGYNGTIFAYGQTGTGKSFTMEGVRNGPSELRGIIPNAIQYIFDRIGAMNDKKFLVRASYLEIYNEEIRDLLSKDYKQRLDLKEHPETGVYVKDLSAFVVKNTAEMDQLMSSGNKNRVVGATNMNEQSSRSHSIFTITVETSEIGTDSEEHIRVGKLNLVDLAGSERQGKTGATGERLKEATKINLSLSALGNVISALVDGRSSHVPYRDSKLTRLLQDSLGGNAKTVMLATMSPSVYNYDETLSTLRYANRAKDIKNKPIINEDPKDAMLREFQEEIKRLKQMLATKRGVPSGNKSNPTESVDDQQSVYDDLENDDYVAATTDEPNFLDDSVMAELQAGIEGERMALLASKDIAEAEKARMAAELEVRASELQREREECQRLAQQLQMMESKLLIGGLNIFEHAEAQAKAITEAERALELKRQQEAELQKKIDIQQEAQMQIEESYVSLQEEVDTKTRKIKKLWAKIESAKSDVEAAQDAFRAEKEDLLDAVRELSRELLLKSQMIDNFIPSHECVKVERRAIYDEDTSSWYLADASQWRERIGKIKRPNSTPGLRQPMSALSKQLIANGNNDVRYRPENIMIVPLDLPDRTTRDQLPAGKQQARLSADRSEYHDALQAALSPEEPDIYVNATTGFNHWNSASNSAFTIASNGGSQESVSNSRPPRAPLSARRPRAEADPTPNSNASYPNARKLLTQQRRYA